MHAPWSDQGLEDGCCPERKDILRAAPKSYAIDAGLIDVKSPQDQCGFCGKKLSILKSQKVG